MFLQSEWWRCRVEINIFLYFILRDIYFVSFGGLSNYPLQTVDGVSNYFYHVILLKKLINFNLPPSRFKGLIRMYTKEGTIRPVINWQNTHGYNLAKSLKYILESHISVPNSFRIKNLPLFKT